jgi:hypothetical protein
MQKLLLSTVVFLVLLPASFAQSVQPLFAPDDIVLEFQTQGNRRDFHLGELIPIKYSYSAATPGKYFRVDPGSKLEGGRRFEIACSPSGEPVVSQLHARDRRSFDQMLVASCGGFGGGVGGNSGGEYSLTANPLSFESPLNMYVRFRAAGTYACEASSGDITTSPRDEKFRPAMLVRSNPIVLNIVSDPAWARSAAVSYEGAYQKLCSGDDVRGERLLQCFDVSRRIAYLDTVDSLAVEVRLFDGRDHGWGNGFWEAIQDSSQPEEALRLMTSRMQDPDFQVSYSTIEWLASSEMRVEAPEAFRGGDPATYHLRAVEILRKYVRMLGSSLSKKAPAVLPESNKTYVTYAQQEYCEKETLIPRDELERVVADIQ